MKFWDNVNFGPSWQAVSRELSIKKQLPLAECARLFALLNMSLANAYIVNWDAKYTYNFWRPVTAIRNGDQDGNDATERDAGWTSFNPTPMHPEYRSQATINATIASAARSSLRAEASCAAAANQPLVAFSELQNFTASVCCWVRLALFWAPNSFVSL